MALTLREAAVRAAAAVAARYGIAGPEPVVLADGANIVVHLRPAPVVAKVAASTLAVRADNQDWLQRELDVSAFLAAEGAPEAPARVSSALIYHEFTEPSLVTRRVPSRETETPRPSRHRVS